MVHIWQKLVTQLKCYGHDKIIITDMQRRFNKDSYITDKNNHIFKTTLSQQKIEFVAHINKIIPFSVYSYEEKN